jgi:hypothetical protein
MKTGESFRAEAFGQSASKRVRRFALAFLMGLPAIGLHQRQRTEARTTRPDV